MSCGPLPPALAADGTTRVRLYGEGGEFLGIGIADGSGVVQPRRLLNPES